MKPSLSRAVLLSFAVTLAALGLSLFWPMGAISLLMNLFFLGALAGWLARRDGWLCGIVVGLPLALFQMTRLAAQDYAPWPLVFTDADYWRVLVPACVVSTGMAIMGGITGAWLQDIKWQRGSSS